MPAAPGKKNSARAEKNTTAKARKTPRTRKPEEMSLEQWQIALRREFGRDQSFTFKNLGREPFFSEFAVTNPKSGRTYRVAVRGAAPGDNFCSCPDFTVNTLGTCKHVEWLLGRLERKRGAKQAFRAGFHPPYSEVFVRYGAERRVCFRPGTACSKARLERAGTYFDAQGFLRPERVGEFGEFVRDSANAGHEVRIYEDALELVARLRDDASRRHRIAREFEGPGAEKAFKALVKTRLYPYQQKGALFAAKAGRCLIADDMGLGKTVQAITAVEILAKTAGVGRVLVVCPTALKHQWKQEIERFTARTARVVEGLSPERRRLYGAEDFYKITNYDTVHRDLAHIARWRPDVVILDEAQRIKNWETRRAQSVKRIDSPHAIVLTGTPLENRLSELHSIMEFVDRFHLGPLFRFLHEHQHVDDHGRVVGYRNLDHIKESLSAVLVRRRKKDVLLELPERTDKHFFVDMTEAQRAIHEENRDTVAQIVAKWRRMGFLTEHDQRRLMISLQFMRMSCNSAYLVDKVTRTGPKIDECHALLRDILESPDTKVVVFSQWLGTHELLMERMNGDGGACAFYHGSLDSKNRKSVIDRFKNDAGCRVLFCTDSGGVGLNLQIASALVNMDQPWNPAVLEQRVGRVHRLGQHRNVQVYHFIARDTIEHGMLDVLKFKSAMFEGVLDGGETEIFLGGSKMKKFMDTVDQVSGAIPAHVPVAEEFAEPELTPEDEAPWEEPDEEKKEEAREERVAAAAQPQSPLDGLLELGAELLNQFSRGMREGGGAQAPVRLENLVVRDGKTGRAAVHIPLPDADTAQKLGDLLGGLGALLKGFAKDR
ncbi:MAG: DEAD/DEAH box helicase [Candidatus Hydrogenedens sp.]|nr:DEAD/DEAH box helicase [Candidatus Hydrogenedentota bacterium]NLF56763.1 DEAD/DEAH box helicase [Candidatus Hydrogenedens sp.]